MAEIDMGAMSTNELSSYLEFGTEVLERKIADFMLELAELQFEIEFADRSYLS